MPKPHISVIVVEAKSYRRLFATFLVAMNSLTYSKIILMRLFDSAQTIIKFRYGRPFTPLAANVCIRVRI
jgi:hypothetical protein